MELGEGHQGRSRIENSILDLLRPGFNGPQLKRNILKEEEGRDFFPR